MTEEPEISPQDLVAALQQAFDLNLTRGVMDYAGKFLVEPQKQEGKSLWAELLRGQKIQPSDALWAFRGKDRRRWLALRIQWKGRTYLFNLQNREDQAALKKLEGRVRKECQTSLAGNASSLSQY